MYKYGLVQSELGNIVGAVWSDNGVCSISSGYTTLEEALEGISKIYPNVVLGEHAILKLLDEYLLGRKSNFAKIKIDYGKATEFQKRVWENARLIPYGEVRTYGELAHVVSPGSQRAVGQALGKNPVPILVPWHRIVAAGGKLGGFTGDILFKERLLALEGVTSYER